MSIEEMSRTLRKEILERLKQQYAGTGGRNADARLENFLDYTSTERIRADTDTKVGRHESIMSRGAFQNLANELSAVLNSSSLSTIASQSLSSDVTFEAFKEYLTDTVKLNTGTGKARTAGDFSYTGVSRIGKESGLTIATSVDSTDKNPSDRDVLILRNIPIGNLVNYYVDFLVDNLVLAGNTTKEQAAKELRKQFNAGHLTGAFNARLVRALGLRKNPEGNVVFDNTKGNSLATKAESELNKIMSLITDADYLSSNIVNDIQLFVTTDKRLYKNKVNLQLTTEVQFAKANQDSGRLLQQAGSAISALTKAVKENVSESGQEVAVEKALVRLYSNLQKLSKEVSAKANSYKNLPKKLSQEAQKNLDRILENTDAINEIIKSPGSRSVPQHVAYLVECALRGINAQEDASKAKIKDSVLPKNKVVKNTGSNIKLNTTKSKVSAKTNPIKSVVQSYSLASLQLLINSHLQDVISANMGSGNSKNMLNYRTGRFAASAKVERMSQSREGMITAFYSYMKNPYQTFEPGYRQGSPKTRDPKLLIAGSIREIAASKVSDRMRAVSL
jgi:hypothetical protein